MNPTFLASLACPDLNAEQLSRLSDKLQGEARQDFFVGPAWTGSVQKYLCGCTYGGESHSGYWPNLAYFCTECGEIWARGVYTYEFNYQPIPAGKWRMLERRCSAHGDGTLIESDRLDAFSVELLLREFHILVQFYGGTENVKRESKEGVRRDQ